MDAGALTVTVRVDTEEVDRALAEIQQRIERANEARVVGQPGALALAVAGAVAAGSARKFSRRALLGLWR